MADLRERRLAFGHNLCYWAKTRERERERCIVGDTKDKGGGSAQGIEDWRELEDGGKDH